MAADFQPSGLFGAAHRLLDTTLGTLQNRFELFALEFRQERTRALELLVWVSTALFLGMMTVLVLTATIILLFPDDVRVYVAGGFCVLYLLGALGAFFRLRARLNQPSSPFADSINEIKKDREWLQAK